MERDAFRHGPTSMRGVLRLTNPDESCIIRVRQSIK